MELAGPLALGSVQRVVSVVSQGGGKGVNISRAAVSAGIASIAVLPADREDPFVHELLSAGIDCRPSRPAGEVRVNLTITEPDGTTTKLNSPGVSMDAEPLDDLSRALLHRAPSVAWVVLAGSLPPGAPDDYYAGLVSALHDGPAQAGGRHQRGPARRARRRPAGPPPPT